MSAVEMAVQATASLLQQFLVTVGSFAYVVFTPPPQPYYFNAATGNDANDCASLAAACQTITRAMSRKYIPGDKLLFAGSFTGNVTMTPTTVPGLGDPNKPIVVGSIDPANRATVTSGLTGDTAVVLVDGVSGVTVTDLILRGGDLAHMPRAGVMLQNSGSVPISGFVIRNSDIANIAYFVATKPPGPSGQGNFGGHIFLKGYPGTGGMSNLLIENNDIHGLSGPTSHDDTGVSGWGGQRMSNLTIRNNRIWDIGGGPTGMNLGIAYPPLGDGIQVVGWNNTLIERNVVHDVGGNMSNCGGPAGILTYGLSGALVQFNEVYRVQPVSYVQGCDWIAIDADNGSQNVVIQYNYTHDNFNSGYLLFDGNTDPWNNNTVRYNISQNDSAGGMLNFGCISISSPHAVNVYVYGNTCFNNLTYHGVLYQSVGQGAASLSVTGTGNIGGLIANNLFMTNMSIYGHCHSFNARNYATGWAPTVTITNNEFQCLTPGVAFELWWITTMYSDWGSFAAATGKFQNNTTADPMITSGGTGPTGYVLQRLSPMIGSGVNHSTLVPTPPTVDYFGNAVPSSAGYNRGADGAAHP
jgi:hypothetical protein